MNIAFPLILVAFALFIFWKRRGDITPDEARELIAKGALLVDVRTQGEYNAHHIPGARNIPLDQLSSRAGDLKPKDAPVIVYCQSGARSSMAKGMLKRAGRTEVRNLGAISRW